MSQEHVLITGAASGIGAATARFLAPRDGILLTLIDRSETGLQDVAAGLGSARVKMAAMDVADPAAW